MTLARWLLRIRNRHLLLIDLVSVLLVPVVSYAVRFEGFSWHAEHAQQMLWYMAITAPLRLALFRFFGLYQVFWRYATVTDLLRIVRAAVASGVVGVVVGLLVIPGLELTGSRVPLSVLVTGPLLMLSALALPRLGLRMLVALSAPASGAGRPVVVVGAGKAGQMVLRALAEGDGTLLPVALLDDDESKLGMSIGGVPVRGTLNDLEQVVRGWGARELIIALPAAEGGVLRRIVAEAAHLGVAVRTVPDVQALLTGRLEVGALRRVEIADLLRRAPITTDLQQVAAELAGKRVLVTGAGGSIGSELCRQVARCGPAELVLLGHGENSIFDIHTELRALFPGVALIPCIADVRDAGRLAEVFARHRPEVVFHAAAHKHVPLMEANVIEALTNNVLGTHRVLEAAQGAGTGLLVLISTDKAVRPTSVMGTTKRVAELLVQRAARRSGQRYLAVRFGNVLGSRGSVVPTFLKQIEAGGPVTVTHPEMRRYFMTIPEAVQLVLQAASLGQGGELLALDMGEPVVIAEMARDLIRLAGREPDVDIRVEFTGTRPGEKLYEEVFQDDGAVERTAHPKVLRVRDCGAATENDGVLMALVARCTEGGDAAELLVALASVVPEWRQQVVNDRTERLAGLSPQLL